MRQIQAIITLLIWLAYAATPVHAEDWPQYKRDAHRSSVSGEKLAVPLNGSWRYEPPQDPRPAWPEPGKELHRIDFDYAPQVAVAGGRVFFGSTADDTVRAMDLETGAILWRFTTGAPVRFAPAVADGKVYVASDDGIVYCLEAGSGKEVWRFQAAPERDLLLGNGRMISRWPLRSGVLALNGVIHVAAGMWPDEGVHLYSLDAKTGSILWRNDSSGALYLELPHPNASGFSGVAPQGYLSAADEVLMVPTGRGIAAGFNRTTGDLLHFSPGLYDLKYNGGAWSSVFQDVYFTPQNSDSRGTLPNIGEVKPVKGNSIDCLDLKTGKKIFHLSFTTEVLAAGERLYAAGGDSLIAYDLPALRKGMAPEKAIVWKTPHPRTYCLALAGDSLLVGGADTLEAFDVATGKKAWKTETPGQVRGLAVADGRVLASTNKGIVSCFGSTNSETKTILESGAQSDIPEKISEVARNVIAHSSKKDGYALVVGANAPAMARALVAASNLHVIQPSQNAAQAQAERLDAINAGYYGSRLAIPVIGAGEDLPFAPYFADLVVIAGKTEDFARLDIFRCVRPCGGTMVFSGVENAEIERLIEEEQIPPESVKADDAGLIMIVRGALPGAGEWRYSKADGGNTAIGHDTRLKMPLELLWFGGPGPDRMMDRHFSAAAPLSVAGRVFVTGMHDFIAYDAYNGRELWSVPIKNVGRADADKHTGNMVADDTSVFVAVQAKCLRIDQATGKTLASYAIPPEVAQNPGGWGYVNLDGNRLIGSVLSAPYGSALQGGEVANAINTVIFALDIKNNSLLWRYMPKNSVPSLTMASGDGRLYFLEVPDVSGKEKRRGQDAGKPELVALNLTDGTEVWRQKNPAAGRQVIQFSQGIVTLSANGGYDAATGKELWRTTADPVKLPAIQGNWIIAQPHAYDLKTGKPRMIADPVTGKERPWEFLRAYGCGSSSGCANLLFFRSGNSGFFDTEAGGTTTFGGVKPNCGISMIGANGVALLTEASSGCSCSYNYQTSLALIPAEDRQREKWFVFPGKTPEDPLTQINLALGAPGDRRDESGRSWLSYPRPLLPGAMPVALRVSSKHAQWYRHPRRDKLPANGQPWIYSQGVRDPGKITLNLFPARPLEIPPAEPPIAIDGRLDDGLRTGTDGAFQMDFIPYRAYTGGSEPLSEGQSTPAGDAIDLRDFHCQLYLRADGDNLYVIIQSAAPKLTEGRSQWSAAMQGEDAEVWRDDSWEIFLTDAAKDTVAHLGVSASGARFDGLWKSGAKTIDTAWNGEWKSAVSTSNAEMVAELAIAWTTLKNLGIDRQTLMLNAIGTGPCALGGPALGFGNDFFSGAWSGLLNIETAAMYTFSVRADDDNRLWIDGKKLIDFMNPLVAFPSTPDPPGERSATVELAAGLHAIRYEHADRRGTTESHLYWSMPGSPKAVIPPSAFTTVDGRPGLIAQFWANEFFGQSKNKTGTPAAPVLTRTDSNIDFDWGPRGWRAELVPSGEVRSGRAVNYVALMDQSAMPVTDQTYSVKLHFAELDGVQPRQRVFSVYLQGRNVIEELDICKEAGGCNRPLIKEFRGVFAPKGQIELALVQAGASTAEPPILSAIEVAAENRAILVPSRGGDK